MNIFSGLEGIVEKDVPLAPFTWYGLGGNADYFIRPKTMEQLSQAAKQCSENGVNIYVLGFGSNLLIRDEGVRGAVIKLEGQCFCEKKFQGELLTVGAGENVGKLVLDCVRKELSGLEALTGIPGSVGGAVRMNAGGSFGDIGGSVESVTLMDKFGNIYEKCKPELVFDYRTVNITAKFVLGAKIKLTRSEPDTILRTVKEIWIYKKNSQPLNTKSAGCVFKNPRGLSSGALIDRAGLKGLSIGGAAVSDKHANFIVANKGCKASDVEKLIGTIKQRVKEKFGVELELEIEIW
jgi:UDP-N-acetylmuramate dehydrogenase